MTDIGTAAILEAHDRHAAAHAHHHRHREAQAAAAFEAMRQAEPPLPAKPEEPVPGGAGSVSV